MDGDSKHNIPLEAKMESSLLCGTETTAHIC